MSEHKTLRWGEPPGPVAFRTGGVVQPRRSLAHPQTLNTQADPSWGEADMLDVLCDPDTVLGTPPQNVMRGQTGNAIIQALSNV